MQRESGRENHINLLKSPLDHFPVAVAVGMNANPILF